MKSIWYYGVHVIDGHCKSLICDTQRRDFFRIKNVDLRDNSKQINELYTLELLKKTEDYNLNYKSHTLSSLEFSTTFFSLVWYFDSAFIQCFKSLFDKGNFKSLVIVITNETRTADIIEVLNERWPAHVEIFIDCSQAHVDRTEWQKNSVNFSKIVLYNSICNNKIGNFYESQSPLLLEGEPNILNDSYFNCNQELFIESNFYNPALFGKLYLKNSRFRLAGTQESIDSLSSAREDIFQSNVIPDIWTSTKSKTDICQHCEFRHVCIDNRLPTQRKTDGLWYHTTECNYNPYIAKWKGEEGYRTLAECGVKSDETGFSIEHERIAKINEELWGSPL